MKPQDYMQRVDELLQQARAAALAKREPPPGVLDLKGPYINSQAFMKWGTSALSILRLTFGETSDYYHVFKSHFDSFTGHFFTFSYCRGVLEAAMDDLEHGALVRIQDLAASEVFEDLLEMAEYLHSQKHHLSAAAIAGAVLEDGLRKLCGRKGVTWAGHSSIGKLSKELYAAGVYDNAQFGQIEAWGKLRNKVDHGDFTSPSDVASNDVQRMVGGIRDFLVKCSTY